MYKVKMDGQILYYPGDKEAVLINPVLNLQAGYAGTFESTIPPSNPLYSKIRNRNSMVSVFRDSKEIFYGEITKQPKMDRYKNKSIYCTGAMSFLSDSIQPQAEYHDKSPREMLEIFLENHNNQVEARKKIYLGQVSITDTNDSLSLYRYTNFETTLKAIREKLVERLGGYLRLRHENEKLYLDWITLEEYGKYCEQSIGFGLNLLDYSESRTAENIVTALIPLGSRLQGESEIEALEKYVDITSVNGDSNYIYNQEAVENFGWVWATNTWQDVTESSNLLKKGKEWLQDKQFEDLTLELTAVDLSMIDREYDSFEIGDRIRCRAKPYGMDKIFPVTEMKIPLQKPDGATLTLGENRKLTYTEQQNRIYSGVTATAEERRKIQNRQMKTAIDNLTAKMTGTAGGYHLTEFDNEGRWLRELYMDAPDKEQATRILQINKDGIGGSCNGYAGPYTVGLTLDGQIVGEQITAESIGAEKLSIEYKTELEGKFSQASKNANDYTDTREKAVKELITTSIKSVEDKIQLAVIDQKSITNRYNYIKGGDNQNITISAFDVTNASAFKSTAGNINAILLSKTNENTAIFQQPLGELPAGTYEVEIKIYTQEGKKPDSCYFGLLGNISYQYLSTADNGKWYSIKRTITYTGKGERSFYFSVSGSAGKQIYLTDIRVLRNVKELIDDVDARITVEAGKITQQVSEIYEANTHNYCTNGAFSDGTDKFAGWKRSDETKVTQTTISGKTCAQITESANASWYQRPFSKKGKVKVRFKAACAEGQEKTARIRVSIDNTSHYIDAGELSTSWKTFEFENDATPPYFYTYFYAFTADTTVYITDVEIMGYATHYAEAQLQLTANDITAEVKRAEKAEETLQSKISINAEAIKLRVSKGDISSEISTESGKISLKSNRISIDSTNFTLTASGYVTMKGASCQGSFEAKNGQWWMLLNNGQITGGYSSATYGYIDFNGAYGNTKEHTLRIIGNTCVDIKGNLCTAVGWNDGTVYTTFTGTRNFITNIRDLGSGRIEWTTTTYTFRNGLMM